MHLNISYLQHHFDELSDLLNKLNNKLSVIGISESQKGHTPTIKYQPLKLQD